MCSELTTKTTEQRRWRQWTYFTLCSSVSIVNFDQLNVWWEKSIELAEVKLRFHQLTMVALDTKELNRFSNSSKLKMLTLSVSVK